MAIAYHRINGELAGVRNFMVPKRAGELKYWYKAAQKAVASLPPFEPKFLVNPDITLQTIILSWEDGPTKHQLLIHRKKTLG